MSCLDWDQLRQRSLNPGGFRDERAVIWPQVLNVPASTSSTSFEHLSDSENHVHEKSESPPHRDERQIMLDTDRSFVQYPLGENDEAKEEMKAKLNELIVSVFRKRPTLNYYQGYHDIISVLFLTLPPEVQLIAVENLSLQRLRDSMGPGLEPLIGLLRLLKNLLRLVDPEYAQLLERNTPTPYYALSNLLTLFSHDMPTLALIQHTFDYLFVRPPVACVYVAAALILSRKEEIHWLEAVGEEGMLHSILSSLPILYEEGEGGSSSSPLSGTEGAQEAKAENTAAAVDDNTEVDALPNGAHVLTSTVKSEESVLEPAPDVPPPMSALPDVREETVGQRLAADSPSMLLGYVDIAGNVFSPTSNLLAKEPDEMTLGGELMLAKSPASIKDATLLDETIEKVDSEVTNSSPASTSPPSNPEPEVLDSWPDTPGQPTKARMSLSSLLCQADDLFVRFPPSHPELGLDKIMGPRSVIFTWTESFSFPSDDELEQYVRAPDLVVLPYVDPVEAMMKEKQAKESEMGKTEGRRKLRKNILAKANVRKKTLFAGAVLALGIAVVVYGIRAPGDAGRGHRGSDLRKLFRFVGGLLLAGGNKFVARLLGYYP